MKKMFCGLTSRWMIPAACAAASASTRSRARRRTCSGGQRSGGQPVGERLPLDEVHDVVREAVALIGPMDRHDVRVLEAGEQAGLAKESFPCHRGGELGTKQLDGDQSIERHLTGAVHDTHPTSGEPALQFKLGCQSPPQTFEQWVVHATSEVGEDDGLWGVRGSLGNVGVERGGVKRGRAAPPPGEAVWHRVGRLRRRGGPPPARWEGAGARRAPARGPHPGPGSAPPRQGG